MIGPFCDIFSINPFDETLQSTLFPTNSGWFLNVPGVVWVEFVLDSTLYVLSTY